MVNDVLYDLCKKTRFEHTCNDDWDLHRPRQPGLSHGQLVLNTPCRRRRDSAVCIYTIHSAVCIYTIRN